MLDKFSKSAVLAALSISAFNVSAGSLTHVTFDELDGNNKVVYSTAMLISEFSAKMSTLNHTDYLVKECSSNNGKVTEVSYGKQFSDGYDVSFSEGGAVKSVKIIEYKIDDSKYSLSQAKENCFRNEVVQLKQEYSTELNLRDGEVKLIESLNGGKLRLTVNKQD